MKTRLFAVLAFLLTSTLFAQTVQSPEEFLGYKLGERYTPHHKVFDYFNYISEQLSNVELEKYGETYEHRPLFVSYISSQKNIDNLEEIRLTNLGQAGIKEDKGNGEVAIVWMSYNVHGNEGSATEAAINTLYKLVTEKKDLLENTLVIIDPCLNPDGHSRYVNWYMQVQGSPYDVDQNSREHDEPWPGGRPNHYLFDLNRDWAWATQIESQQRLKIYNEWLPHIHADYHEQGINSPYYFAPAAEPFHEIISDWQRDFQTQIGKNNAKLFDQQSWLYFTKERFDLLYPSYGDTYPTFMGAIGMTYEQAGNSRSGLGITTDHGYELTLTDRVKHQTTTSLSNVEVASKNVAKLNTEFRKFFDNRNLTYKSYVLKNENKDKTDRLIDLLDKHEIEYQYTNKGQVRGYNYQNQKEGRMNVTDKDLVIHTDQPKGKMVKVLFEPNTQLADSLTYDITAWSLPYAHGFKAMASKTKVNSRKDVMDGMVFNKPALNSYAYISKWNSLEDATFLAQALHHGMKARVAAKDFTIEGNSYKKGSILFLRHDNREKDFDKKLTELANIYGRTVKPVQSGMVSSGVDFGSYGVSPINKQKVLLLSGEGTSSRSFGEVWHFFEKQLEYPVTVVNTSNLGRVDLNQYDVLVMPNGYYGGTINESQLKKVTEFARSGGTVIAIGNALRTFANKKGFSLKTKKSKDEEKPSANLTPYADQERQRANYLITGAVFKSKVDNTHPLAFGYGKEYFTLKIGSSSYDYLQNGSNVAYLTKEATNVSGFAGQKALERIPESLLIGEERKGRGTIIYFVDNVLFRSFWENGKMFFVNAVFFRNSDEIKR
jgi:hypothetical protein